MISRMLVSLCLCDPVFLGGYVTLYPMDMRMHSSGSLLGIS